MERSCFGLFLLFFIFIFIGSISALKLNEVMPDCGNLTSNCEFIELYSETLQDLTGYVLDTTGQKLNLNKSFQGFLVITKHKNAFINRFGSSDVIEWKGMGLANSGDKVELIYNNQSIDSFSYSKANKNSSWQFIAVWKECEPTPLKENKCVENQINDIVEEKTEKTNTQTSNNSVIERVNIKNNESNNEDNEIVTKIIKIVEEKSEKENININNDARKDVIRLNTKKDINIYKSKNQLIKENAIYVFALLCIIIIAVLFFKRKSPYRENG